MSELIGFGIIPPDAPNTERSKEAGWCNNINDPNLYDTESNNTSSTPSMQQGWG